MTKLKKYFPVLIIAIVAIIFLTRKKSAISKESQFLEPLDPNDCFPDKDDNVKLPFGSQGIQVKRLQIRMSYLAELLKAIKSNSSLEVIARTDNVLEAYEQFLLHKGVDGILGQYTDSLRTNLFNIFTPDDPPTLLYFRNMYSYLKNYNRKAPKSVMNNISDNSNFN